MTLEQEKTNAIHAVKFALTKRLAWNNSDNYSQLIEVEFQACRSLAYHLKAEGLITALKELQNKQNELLREQMEIIRAIMPDITRDPLDWDEPDPELSGLAKFAYSIRRKIILAQDDLRQMIWLQDYLPQFIKTVNEAEDPDEVSELTRHAWEYVSSDHDHFETADPRFFEPKGTSYQEAAWLPELMEKFERMPWPSPQLPEEDTDDESELPF